MNVKVVMMYVGQYNYTQTLISVYCHCNGFTCVIERYVKLDDHVFFYIKLIYNIEVNSSTIVAA